MDQTTLRPYELSDNLRAGSGTVWLTGTQALVRLMLMQRQRDAAAGLRTGGFVSGYRGSPLGMVDQQMWKARPLLEAAGVQFLPAINEDLAATACLGTQRVALDPARRVDGVFALWYGKGPGVDRAGDALKHGHVFGASPLGGVLAICGDDHGCVSSSMPHQSDLALAHFGMPVLHPANVAEYLEFGLYGWALSRYSGAWVGFKAISEVVESGMTVDLDAVPIDFALPVPPEVFSPTQDLHVRSVDLPSLALESRAAEKLDAVRAFARFNAVDKHVVVSPRATLGIVTVGKARAGRCRRARLQGRPGVAAGAHAHRGVRPRLAGHPRHRGEGTGGGAADEGAALRPARRPAAPHRRQDHARGRAAALGAGRIAPLAHHGGGGRLAGTPEPGARPAPPGGGLHHAHPAEQRG